MATLYDDEGNLIEGAMTAEEAKALQEDKAKKEAELAEVKEKLSKLENKDFNFKKLRDMNKEEKDKLTAHEMELLQRQEKLEDDQKSFLQRQIDTHKNEASAVLAGDDDELRKKILFHYDRIKDEAVGKEDIYKKMREAAVLAKAEGAFGVSPIIDAMNVSGNPPTTKKDNSKLTPDQKDLASKFGLSEDDLKKHNVI